MPPANCFIRLTVDLFAWLNDFMPLLPLPRNDRASDAECQKLAGRRAMWFITIVGIGMLSACNSTADALQERDTPNRELAMDVSEIVTGGNQFAVDLYQQLARDQSENIFFSPASISVALTMTAAGARGETAEEMFSTLHLPTADPAIHDRMAQLQSMWATHEPPQGVRLEVANRLWGQQNEDFLPEFLAITRTQYGAELARLDFRSHTEESRETINTWVADQTKQKITDLIPAGVLHRDTLLVLTNAVYFLGLWSEPFDKEATKDDAFHVSSDQTVDVPFMYQNGRLRYASTDGLQVLELAYGTGDFSMVVLLPEEKDGLVALEDKLTAPNLAAWSSQLRPTEVLVYLPRFKTTSQFTLNKTLQSLGMVDAFNGGSADFSGINGQRNLYISAALHKAYVDVHEEGTEAAAATGVVVGRTSLSIQPKEPPVFRADHPFLFMIRDNRNSAILFLGRLINPKE